MDPREVEMVAIVNMQTISEDVKREVQEIESAKIDQLKIVEEVKKVDDVLEPGKKIRPEVTEQDARKLAERLYGIVTKEICELNSYDDRNYLIHADRNIKNPIIPNNWPHGYVLKIQNSLDSTKQDFADAQTQLMLFLGQQNINCPKPVMNIYGKYFSLEKLGKTSNIIRLLEFLPGKTINEIPKTNHLLYQAGQFVANIDNALKNFKHDAYERRRSLWMLDLTPKLEDFLHATRDEEKRDIVEQVIKDFDKKVLQNIDQFAKGIIHGDFNEQNIIVNKIDKTDEYKVSGIIDFGDTCYSYYLFELAIAMAYMILDSRDISKGGVVIAGYGMIRNIPDHEKKVLKVCVCARLCQSLVIGAYTHTMDNENEYILTTQKTGWEILTSIWNEPDEKIEELWIATADNYLKQSTK